MKRKNGYLTLEGFMERFSARERAEIEANARRLAVETTTFAKLRKARKLTQVELAKRLRIAQENVSRIENRSDMLVSTLRGFVRAMGGDLRLMALFPGQEAVEVSFGSLREEAGKRTQPKQRRAASKKTGRSKTLGGRKVKRAAA
jgi:transcriptional regulator with XRE-family HTH domain